MSPYKLFPAFTFTERVYKDGFRIILYSVRDPLEHPFSTEDRVLQHSLYPYEAIFEEDSYVKIRTTQNPSNYVFYYDTKYLSDPSYALRRNSTFRDNNYFVKCKVYDFNIDNLKLGLLKINNFDVKQIRGTIDDFWVGVYFDRSNNRLQYELCTKAPNGVMVKAPKALISNMGDTRFMTMTEKDKFCVYLDYIDAYECYKNSVDNIDYMNLKRGINPYLLNTESKDWFCDDKTYLAKLVKYGLPLEFAYKAATTENLVFIVEDIYRCCRDNSIYGPIYKTFID